MKSEASIESENEKKGSENNGRDSNSANRVPILITAAVLVFGVYANSLLFNRKNPSSSAKMGSRRGQRYAEFAEAIADKNRVDQAWLEGSKDHLYSVDVTGLADHPDIVSKLVVLDADADTQEFIRTSVEKSDSLLTQTWHSLAKSVMKWFYSQTDINGYLQRGSMFVFSKEQFNTLMLKADVAPPEGDRFGSLIDLGAGDGRPTMNMAHLFHRVYATEASWSMRSLLEKKNISVLEIEDWARGHKEDKYDAVSCLNLLDRCERPLTLIRQIKGALKPGGFLIVALVLPFRPYVEFGSNGDHKPVEKLPIQGKTFTDQIGPVIQLFRTEGFELKAWSRVPYLCEGDSTRSVYSLDDAVFVFQHLERVNGEDQETS